MICYWGLHQTRTMVIVIVDFGVDQKVNCLFVIGFDEFMNMTLDDAVECDLKTGKRENFIKR